MLVILFYMVIDFDQNYTTSNSIAYFAISLEIINKPEIVHFIIQCVSWMTLQRCGFTRNRGNTLRFYEVFRHGLQGGYNCRGLARQIS